MLHLNAFDYMEYTVPTDIEFVGIEAKGVVELAKEVTIQLELLQANRNNRNTHDNANNEYLMIMEVIYSHAPYSHNALITIGWCTKENQMEIHSLQA